MKMKELLSQKVASQNLDKQLQKLAADLTLDYLADSFNKVYSTIYSELKKLAAENPKESKKKKLLALLGGIAGAGVVGAASMPMLDYILPSVRRTEVAGNITLDYKPRFTWPSEGAWSPLARFENTNPDIKLINKELADLLIKQVLEGQKGPAEGSNMYQPIDQIDLSSLTE